MTALRFQMGEGRHKTFPAYLRGSQITKKMKCLMMQKTTLDYKSKYSKTFLMQRHKSHSNSNYNNTGCSLCHMPQYKFIHYCIRV